jgi:transforming growth factor-beta-induced protein
MGKERFKPGDQTIAEIAIANGNFTTLVAALTCTDLAGVAGNPSVELTVFAPTDGAFAAAGFNADNVCDVPTATLSDILLYHVVAERRPSPSVILGMNKEIETMLAGEMLYPEGLGGLGVSANFSDAMIETPDILASNGIIHVIDTVLLPFKL